jgi:hypothetical protein
MPRGGKREGAGRPYGSRSSYRTLMTKSGAPKEGTTGLLLQAMGKAPLKASDALGLLQGGLS